MTKLTLSDDIEAFMATFERSMEAHEIERAKWPVLLAPQLTGKAEGSVTNEISSMPSEI